MGSLRQQLSKMARAIKGALLPAHDGSRADAEIAARARTFAPVVWLLGKVQSGKTSLIRVMTGCNNAEIGDGFKACTRTARIFDFPEEAPLIRFLDTRGLGEVGYDPSEDLALCEQQAHLVVVTMRALDPQQEAVLEVVRATRRRHPEWPLIVVQSTLHEGYPLGARHVLPYPFKERDPARLAAAGVAPDLVRSLMRQR
ncbi:MAG TPA: GTPase domain-containing protein, partial [Hyphomicrobium sp.]